MPFSTSEYAQRVQAFQSFLNESRVDLAILNQSSDIYYYCGSFQPMYLLAPATGEPLALARKAVERIKTEAEQLCVEVFQSSKDLAIILERHGMSSSTRIGLTLDSISYSAAQRLIRMFAASETVDISWDVRAIRMVKSEDEIAILARAGEIVGKIPELVAREFHPGITELELSAAIEHFLRINGNGAQPRCRREGSEMSFGLCSAGVNSIAGTKFEGISTGAGISAASPYGAGYTPIEAGVPVILDYSLALEGYHIDQTRMFSWGEPLPEVLAAYQAMVAVELAIFDALMPGASWESVWDVALAQSKELGYEDTFMGFGHDRIRFVGHGVGLELDEPPFIAPKMKEPLAEGMVIAIEPKVALPGIGVVGIEDTVVVRKDSPEILTKCSGDFLVI